MFAFRGSFVGGNFWFHRNHELENLVSHAWNQFKNNNNVLGKGFFLGMFFNQFPTKTFTWGK